jgi:hypothetical protein
VAVSLSVAELAPSWILDLDLAFEARPKGWSKLLSEAPDLTLDAAGLKWIESAEVI